MKMSDVRIRERLGKLLAEDKDWLEMVGESISLEARDKQVQRDKEREKRTTEEISAMFIRLAELMQHQAQQQEARRQRRDKILYASIAALAVFVSLASIYFM